MNQNQIFGLVLLATLLYLSHVQIIKLTNEHILLTFILHIIMLFLLSNSVLEGLTTTSNEAVQNLGSVYNSSNATLTNLQVTGTLKVGNTILMNGDSSKQNKIEIYQNSDGLDPKMYFDNTGKFGISGTNGSYISSTGSLLSSDVSVGGNASVGGNIRINNDANIGGNMRVNNSSSVGGDMSISSNLILDGTNKWIIHTPDDGRKTFIIAPYGTDGWNWDFQTTFDGSNRGKPIFPK